MKIFVFVAMHIVVLLAFVESFTGNKPKEGGEGGRPTPTGSPRPTRTEGLNSTRMGPGYNGTGMGSGKNDTRMGKGRNGTWTGREGGGGGDRGEGDRGGGDSVKPTEKGMSTKGRGFGRGGRKDITRTTKSGGSRGTRPPNSGGGKGDKEGTRPTRPGGGMNGTRPTKSGGPKDRTGTTGIGGGKGRTKPTNIGGHKDRTTPPKKGSKPRPTRAPPKKPSTKTDRTVAKQNERKLAKINKNPEFKQWMKALMEATTKAEIIAAIAKIIAAALKKVRTMSDYETRSLVMLTYTTAINSKKVTALEVVEACGAICVYLDIKEMKKMDFSTIKKILEKAEEGLIKNKPLALPKNVQVVIFQRLCSIVQTKDWDEATGKLLKPVYRVAVNDKCSEKLPLPALKGFMSFYKKIPVKCSGRPPRLVQAFLKKHGMTGILPVIGKLICFLSKKQLLGLKKTISTEEDVRVLCRAKWTTTQVRTITSIATNQNNFKDVTALDCTRKRTFSNCWAGVSTKIFKTVSITQSDIDCFNTTSLPTRLSSILRKKVTQALGSMKNMNAEQARKAIKAIRPSAKQLKELSPTVLKEVSEELTKQIESNVIKNRIAVKVAAKLIMKEKMKETGFKLAKMSTKLVGKLTIATMREFSVDQLGFSETDNVNNTSSDSTDDSEGTEGVDLSLASVVVIKLKAKYGGMDTNTDYWRKTIVKVRAYSGGFSIDDVMKIPDDFLLDFISESQKLSCIPTPLLNAVAKRYEKYFTDQGNEALTENDVSVVGAFAAGLSTELLLRITDDADIRMAAIRVIAGYCKLKNFLPARKANLAATALGMMKITSGTEITSDIMDVLGLLVTYVPKKIWEEIPQDVIDAQSESLAQFELSKEIRIVVKTKLEKKYGVGGDASTGLAQMDADAFSKYANIVLKDVSVSDINKVQTDVLKTNYYKLSKLEMSAEVAVAITAKVPNPSAEEQSNRKRRSVSSQDLSNKTASEIIDMGTLLYGLTPTEIKTITNEAFTEALDTIGALKGFTKDQLKAWAEVLVRAYGSLSSIEDADIKRMKHIVLGINETDISQLTLNNTEVIAELSAVVGYTTKQLNAMYLGIKQDTAKTSVKDFSGEELSALGQFVIAADHVEIQKIPTTNYKDVTKDLGDVFGWTVNQMVALKTLAVSAYGAIMNWTSPVVRDTGAAIGGLTAEEINSISPSVFTVVKPLALRQVPVNLFKELSLAHIKALTAEQFAAVTDEQKNALSSDKLEAFNNVSEANKTVDTTALLKNETATTPPDETNTVVSVHPSMMATILPSVATMGGQQPQQTIYQGIISSQVVGSIAPTPSYVVMNATVRPTVNVGCQAWMGECSGSDAHKATWISGILSLLCLAFYLVF